MGVDRTTLSLYPSSTLPLYPPTPLSRCPFEEPFPVHLLVVGAELTGFDPPPPSLVTSVPVHRSAEPFFKRHGWSPAQRSQAATIHSIAAVMSGAILHEADQRPRLTKVLQDPLSQREVLQFVSPADVGKVPRFAVTKHVLDACRVVEYPQPIT